MNPIAVHVHQMLGENCLTFDQGEVIFALLHKNLKEKKRVSLDFSGVRITASAFLNSAVGHLYEDFSGESIEEFLDVQNLNDMGMFTLKKVIENAKEYYTNPNFRRAVDSVFSEQVDE